MPVPVVTMSGSSKNRKMDEIFNIEYTCCEGRESKEKPVIHWLKKNFKPEKIKMFLHPMVKPLLELEVLFNTL